MRSLAADPAALEAGDAAGARPGTGGSAGAAHLRSTPFRPAPPDLSQVRGV